MTTLLYDLRTTLRALVARPTLTGVAILTVALGVGGLTAVFSVIHAVLLRPLPYNDAGRLVVIWSQLTNRDVRKFALSPIDLREIAELRQFVDVAGVSASQLTLESEDVAPERIDVAQVTPGFFRLAGIAPVAGRLLIDEDATPAAKGAAASEDALVLSHGLWQRRFGGDAGAIGRVVRLNGNPYRLVGVLPPRMALFFAPSYTSLPAAPEAWTTPRINVETWSSRRNVIWRVVARLAPGVSLADAQTALDALAGDIRRAESIFETAGFRLQAVPLRDELTAEVQPLLSIVLVAVAFVLLIACTNVANLLLIRGSSRERELAVRKALGASGRRLAWHALSESLVLALAGGVLGVVVAAIGLTVLTALRPSNLPLLDTIAIDGTVLAFSFAVSLISAAAVGAIPAMGAARVRGTQAIAERGYSPASRAQTLVRGGLVVAETALAVVLLVGAGLMLRSFASLISVEPGYRPENLLTFEVGLPGTRYNEAQRIEFWRLFQERLAALPGVRSASGASPLPFGRTLREGRFGPEAALTDESLYGQADYRVVLPEYFETMGTRLLAGRLFDPAEASRIAAVAIVDAQAAVALWPGKSPIGKRVVIRATSEPTALDVVGVVEHQRTRTLAGSEQTAVYLTYPYYESISSITSFEWALRTVSRPEDLVPQVRDRLAALDPALPLASVGTMSGRLDEAQADTRFALVALGGFAGVGLLLALVGVYGVLSTVVAQRTGEIGVRIAVGADRRAIIGLVLRQGLKLTALGIATGLVLGVWATQFMASLLVDTTVTDPPTYAGMAVLFLMVATVACYLPARRASRLDPVSALRQN